jgi:hypothetical protein
MLLFGLLFELFSVDATHSIALLVVQLAYRIYVVRAELGERSKIASTLYELENAHKKIKQQYVVATMQVLDCGACGDCSLVVSCALVRLRFYPKVPGYVLMCLLSLLDYLLPC